MKITTTTTKANGKETISYYIDNILIAEGKKYSDWFCTITKGRPSNIRDKVKKCRSFTWNKEGLVKVIGHSNFTVGSRRITPDFMNNYPDTTWGFSGSIPSKKSIIELIQSKIVQP